MILSSSQGRLLFQMLDKGQKINYSVLSKSYIHPGAACEAKSSFYIFHKSQHGMQVAEKHSSVMMDCSREKIPNVNQKYDKYSILKTMPYV